MFNLDIATLTAAEVDLIEDTLNEQLSKHPAFASRIVTFQDVMGGLKSLRSSGDDGPSGDALGIPLFKLMRAFELVELRRTNPAATWADTGQKPIFTEKPDDAAPAAPAVEPQWSPPSSGPSA